MKSTAGGNIPYRGAKVARIFIFGEGHEETPRTIEVRSIGQR
jgi:hypothetical protein